MDRLSQLKQFVAEEPDDPFNIYALALEYLKSDLAESSRLFETLTQNHPHYLPTYYPYANLLVERKDPAKAEVIFQQGIGNARAQQDNKTLKELLAAYNDWNYER